MPGTFRNFPVNSTMSPQPPPVPPKSGAAKVIVQSWQSQLPRENPIAESLSYGNHVRCSSLDSVDSNISTGSSSGSGHCRQLSVEGEFIPTRTVTKTPSIPSHNPMQFVKVESPLYKKAEQQIKLVKEVKICRDTLKETEEEWQSNLDNWKSRRRKVSEKVFQRAEEMRQIEQEEQLRHHKEQHRKIKTFSEIIEKRSSKRNYNLDLYVGQGDDSGVGGTPEPDEQEGGTIDILNSNNKSDTSEGMTSETDSIDSDTHGCEKLPKEPPKVPRKPHSWLCRQLSSEGVSHNTSASNVTCSTNKDIPGSGNISSAEPSDIEGHNTDIETSEDDAGFCGIVRNLDSGLESLGSHRLNDTADSASDLSQDSCCGIDRVCKDTATKVINCRSNAQSRRQLSKGKSVEFSDYMVEDSEQEVNTCSAEMLDTKEFNFNLQSKKDGSAALTNNFTSGSEEDKQRVTRRGTAFAQKLALFSGESSRLNSASACLESCQIPKTSKEEELQRESLVLRRRSAFENNHVEKEEARNRRSSCVSGSVIPDASSSRDERRLSLDSARASEMTSEPSKKKLPPPVPTKPKTKNKLQKQEDGAQNGENDNAPIITAINSCPASETFGVSSGEIEMQKCPQESTVNYNSVLINENNFSSDHFNDPVKSNETVFKHNVDELQYQEQQPNTEEQFFTEDSYPFGTNHSDNLLCDTDLNDDVFDGIENQTWDFHTTIDRSVTPECIERDVNLLKQEMSELNIVDDYLESDRKENCVEAVHPPPEVERTIVSVQLQSSEPNIAANYKSVVYFENPPLDNVSRINIDCSETFPSDQINMQCIESPSCPEKTDFLCNYEFENGWSNASKPESVCAEFCDYTAAEGTTNYQDEIKNRCTDLLLGKVEEDVSASSSSSGSPDTETVIDNLPTSVSPLPGDELTDVSSNLAQNGGYHNFQNMYLTPPSENLEAIAEENSETHDPSCGEKLLNIPPPKLDDCSEVANVQDEEQCENDELEESADTLSPLDVIDQIELKLMQQLEQEALDDFSGVGNGQLEEEVNRQLLYLSEDADLLDDLDTPRNVVPPSEPPPPPPPEPEKDPFQRINSTKRIKKELWRRRSDFLGLDAPEGINVDDLPPPPPGLEELLKSEMEMQREQRLSIEKRLSIVDAECFLMSDPVNSSILEMSSNCIAAEECNTGYMLEVLDAEVFDAVDSDDPQITDWTSKEKCQSSFSENQMCEVDVANEEKEADVLVETPQHKAKSHIQTLGAAPRAKIVDSNKWITQTKHVPILKQRSVDPVLQNGNYSSNFQLMQDSRRTTIPGVHCPVERRYSMPPAYNVRHPDVTVRTWNDREIQNQLQPRPKSAIWPNHSASINQAPTSYVPVGFFNNPNSWNDETVPSYEEEKNSLGVDHLCSCCGQALSEGSAMGIDALQLYFHIECFRCCICQLQLGNGSCGTDVQVKNSQLYCPKCFCIE